MADFYSNASNGWRLKLVLTADQMSIPNNTHRVNYSWILEKIGVNSFVNYSTYSFVLDGTTIISKSGTQHNVSAYGNVTLASGSRTISHAADGTKSVAFSASFQLNAYNQFGPTTPLTMSGNFALPTIPRASSFTLSGATRTNADINVTISRASTSFTHRVRWRVGSGSWITASSSAGTSASFKVQPSNMANLKSATITVGVQTYSGSTAIGSEATATRTITIPNTTISLSGTASTGSTQTVSISNSGGSLTYTRSWSLGNATGGDSNTWVPPHSAISTSGTLTCTVVTKNGTATINTVSATRTITVPSASSFTLSGATQTNANINVSISKTWSSFNHRVRWRVSGSTSWKEVQAYTWTGTSTSFKVQPSDISNSKSKEIEVGVQTYSSSTTIRSEVILKRTITIPNSTISLSGTAVTGNAQTVSISNSGGSLTYTRSWSLGNATGGNVTSWTPPHSALSGAASGTLTCTVVTKNGTATINTTSATRTITAPNVSSFTLSGATQTNANINVTISKASTAFTHRVRYRVGSGSWTDIQVSSWTGTSTSFKVQPSNMPNLKSATITVGVQAYSDSGATPIRSEVTSTRTITIPDTTITLSGAANTGSTQTVNISNSGGSLTHIKSWKLGSATGGDSLTWTPPHSALPSTTSGTLTCTVVTKNGTATINTTSATRTINVPTGEQPTFTAITHAEAVTNVATLVGAYVQGKTKLKLGVSGAAAAAGSSIKSYSISVAGHTVGNGGTTPVINQSGTLTISATVTDNRNRSVTKTATIEVLPYENPTVTGVTFTRTDSDGTANTSGTHLTVKATVRVRQLIVNDIEKNKIWYQVESARVGYDYETKKNLENEAGSSNGNYRESVYTHTLSGYPVDYPYNIRARGGDIFSWSGYIAGGIPTGLVLQHWGEDTTSFGKMIDDVSYNVLVGAKGLKSDGPIIDKDGKDVSKPSWSDVTGKPSTFAPSSHTHAWSEVTSKPSTFAPSSHTHEWSEVTSKPTTATRWPTWSEVTSKPSTFAPSSHTHSEYAKALTTANGYQGITLNNGATTDWVRTTSNGLIPYASGGASALGTSGWPFNSIYGKTIYENGTALSSKYAPSSHSHSGTSTTGNYTNHTTAHGYIQLGPMNTSYAHIYTDRPLFYFNKQVQVLGSTVYHTGNMPTTATRWPTWSEVTSKPSTFTSITRLYSGTLGANGSATMTSMSGYTFLIVVMDTGTSSSGNRDNMVIPVTNISYSTAGSSFSRISYGAVLRWMNFSFGSATNIRTGSASEIWIKTIYGVK